VVVFGQDGAITMCGGRIRSPAFAGPLANSHELWAADFRLEAARSLSTMTGLTRHARQDKNF
jgi:hypothetical protein